MSKYKNAKEMLETEIPRSARSHLYLIFDRGVKAYNSIINMKEGTFQSIFSPNIKGHLLNFMIFRQFEPDMLSSTFPFILDPQKVNSFKYTTLNLLKNNVKINVSKTSTSNSFPKASKYRKYACQANRFPDDDLFYGVDSAYDKLFDINEPYYVLLTYNVKNNELDYVKLLVPNWNMTRCLAQLDLSTELRLYKPDEKETATNEKIITSLKDEFLNNLPIKGEVNE